MASALPPEMLRFLTKLERNNNREWFQEHKTDFEQHVSGSTPPVYSRL